MVTHDVNPRTGQVFPRDVKLTNSDGNLYVPPNGCTCFQIRYRCPKATLVACRASCTPVNYNKGILQG